MEKFDKIRYLTGRVCTVIRSDVKYLFCFVAVMMTSLVQVLYSIYLVLWIDSFVHSGALESDSQAKKIYSALLTAAAISAMIVVPIFGKYADKIPPSIIIPLVFFIRSATAFQVQKIDDPNGNWFAIVSVSIVLASTIQVITVTTLFIRNLPNDIRGTMVGIWQFFANLGCTIFSLVGGILFDEISPSAPFDLVAVCDAAICILAIILACFGSLRY